MSALAIDITHRDEHGFSLQVATSISLGGVTALFGPSGSGKTTLLDCIAGLRPDIDNASIQCADELWQSGATQKPAWDRSVGYVFQDARLLPHLTVEGNLVYAEARQLSAVDASAIIQWLDLSSLMTRKPAALSAGQKQRVAIARAMLRGPRLLLLDEPLANLDRVTADECLNYLQRVSTESALPMIYVSHRMEEVSRIADHLLIIRDGRIIDSGPVAKLMGRLDTELAEDEAAAALLEVSVDHYDPDFALTELRVDGEALWVSGEQTAGNHRLRIAARDVSVCRQQPDQSSILNVLPVTLDDVRDVGSAHCMLRLQLKEQVLLARITRRSREELKLEIGDALFAQIKATAILRSESP
ncbi:MAG: molybdenum ABC transporter ATP-binding protein [Pseudomonadota bacterium]